MVSTNSALAALACRTSPHPNVKEQQHQHGENPDCLPALLADSIPTASARRRTACPYLSWRLSSFVPRASRGLLGLGFSPPMCFDWR